MRNFTRYVVGATAVGVLAICAVQLASAQCSCPFQGDMNGDGIIDPVDDGPLLEALFFDRSSSNPQDPQCPTSRGDFNADGIVDIIDMESMWDHMVFGAPPPVNPCAPGFPFDRTPGAGTGTVIVESNSVPIGTRDTIGVYLTNSTNVGALMIPLVIREIDTYPTSLSMQIRSDGRLFLEFGAPVSDLWLHGFETMDGDCAGGPGTGFGAPTIGQYIPGPDTIVAASPDAFRVSLVTLFDGPLSPGSDTVPSIEIVFTAPTTTGVFEIDTICTNPDNHLAFFEDDIGIHGEIIPSFTKGVITIDCHCPFRCDFDESGVLDAVDLNGLIEALFFGGPDPQYPVCPTTGADFNNDTNADAVDLNLLIDHLFFGEAGPIDPCAGI